MSVLERDQKPLFYASNLLCGCGFVMVRTDGGLFKCSNPDCEDFGSLFRVPPIVAERVRFDGEE